MKATGLILASAIATAAAIGSASCTGRGSNDAVPKPEAWPRIELPGENYKAHTIGHATLHFNAEASVSTERNDGSATWITVRYPQFRNAAVYLTLTSAQASEIAGILANRRERMELNAGGATTVITELTSAGGWHCELAETRTSLTTPLQLLATDSTSVLSGTFYLDLPAGSSADSISPVVKAVSNDLLHLLKNCANE